MKMLEKHLDYLNTNHFLSSLSPLAFHEHLSSSFSPFSSSLSRALSLSFSSCSSSSHLNISTRNTRSIHATYYLRSNINDLTFLCSNPWQNKRKKPWKSTWKLPLLLLSQGWRKQGQRKTKNDFLLSCFIPFIVTPFTFPSVNFLLVHFIFICT